MSRFIFVIINKDTRMTYSDFSKMETISIDTYICWLKMFGKLIHQKYFFIRNNNLPNRLDPYIIFTSETNSPEIPPPSANINI